MRRSNNPPHYNIAYTRPEFSDYRSQMPVYEQPSPIKRPIGQVIPHVNVVPERRRIFISTEGGIPRTVSTIASGPYTIQGSPIIRRLPVGKTTVITQRPMFVETPPVANTVTVETSSSPVKTVRWEKTPSYYPSPANFNRGLGETVPMDENQSHGPVVVKTKESPKKVVEKSDESPEKKGKDSEPSPTKPPTEASQTQKSEDSHPPSKTPELPETKKRRRKDPVKQETDESTPEEEENEEFLFKRFRIEYTDGTGGRGYQPSENEFLCPKCPAQYESRVGLTNHMKLHGTNKTHACDLCDFSCTNKKTMRHHKRAHGILFNKRQRRSRKKKEEGGEKRDEKVKKEIEPKKEVGSEAKKAANVPKAEMSSTQIVEKMNQVIANVTGGDKLDDDPKKRPSKSQSPEKKQIPHDPRAVKCPDCPFRTRTQARLGPHQLGHTRRSGYQCPSCTFKSESLSFLKRHYDLHDGSEDFAWPPAYAGGNPPKEKKEESAPWVSPRKKAQMAAESVATRTRHKNPVVTAEPERKSPRKMAPKKVEVEEKPVTPKKRALGVAEQGSSKAKMDEKSTSSKSSSLKSAKMAARKVPANNKGEGKYHCAQCGIKLKRYGELKIHILHFHKANRKSPEVVRRFLRERIARTYATK